MITALGDALISQFLTEYTYVVYVYVYVNCAKPILDIVGLVSIGVGVGVVLRLK